MCGTAEVTVLMKCDTLWMGEYSPTFRKNFNDFTFKPNFFSLLGLLTLKVDGTTKL